MDANTPYLILQYIVNKNQNGYLSPDDYNLIINQAQVSYQSFLIGEFQKYQYGRAVDKVELGMTERVAQTLAPFITDPIPLSINVSGKASYPPYHQQVVAMNYGANFDRIRFVQQDSLYSYLKSRIDPVTTNPVYLLTSTGFTFYPSNLGTAYLTYISKPPNIVWGYYLDINGIPTYDVTQSVAPLWYDIDMLEIIARAAQMLGINLQANQVEQYATSIKNQGQ